MELKKWIKRQYIKLRMYWKMWKSLHTYPDDWDTWQQIGNWMGHVQIGFKHNPYYFSNMGNIIPIDTHEKYNDMTDKWVFIPFPIHEDLFLLMNDYRLR